MVEEGLVIEAVLTDEGMSLESEMVDNSLVMEAGLTDEGISLESETVNEGSVMKAGLTCHIFRNSGGGLGDGSRIDK